MNARMRILAAAACSLLTLSVVATEPVPLFSGNNSYVNLGTPAALQIPSNEPFTVEGWMLFHALSTVDMLYCKNNGRVAPYTYMLGFSTGKLAAYNTAWRGNFAVNRQIGRWYHVAFAFDGVNMAFYLDGTHLGTTAFSFNNNTAHTVKIGGYASAADIKGSMSDVRVWDHARSALSITDNMRRRLFGNESGLLGYWPLNEGTGTVVLDGTANASTGTVVGATWVNDDDLELLPAEAEFRYANPFSLVSIETGNAKFTNSNVVDVAAFPIPDGFDRYQINQSSFPDGIDPEKWTTTNDLPQRLAFDLPATDSNIVFYAWFTNMAATVTVARASGFIRYTETNPLPAARLTHSRTLVPGQPVVLQPEEIDNGSSGGETGGKLIPLHALSLNLVSGPDINATPESPFVTVSALGTYEVELVVVNAAGNVATSSVCQVEVGAYAGAPFAWTGAADNDWHNPLNWNWKAVPIAGYEAVLNAGATVRLSAGTPALSAFTMNGGTLTFENWETRLEAASVTIRTGTITHVNNDVWAPDAGGHWVPIARVWVECEAFYLGTNATIAVSGRGYSGRTAATGSGTGFGPGGGRSGTASEGASHGGSGYRYPNNGWPAYYMWDGNIYGSLENPVDPGSGGGVWDRYPSGSGGGVVRIDAQSGPVVIDGQITANGTAGPSGGRSSAGSGGSVWITCATIRGSGGVYARGGADYNRSDASAGGGGRIAVHYDPVQQSQLPFPELVFSAAATIDGTRDAEDGTLYFTDNWFWGAPVFRHGGAWYSGDASDLVRESLVVSNCSLTLRMPGVNLTVTNDLSVLETDGRLILQNDAIRVGGNLNVDGGQLAVVFAAGADRSFEIGGNAEFTNGAVWRVTAAATNNPATEHGGEICIGGRLTLAESCWVLPQAQPFNGAVPRFFVGTLAIAAGAGFNANLLGYSGAIANFSAGFGPGRGISSGSGGGYGGKGGDRGSSRGGGPYGSPWAPLYPGSGGGRWDRTTLPAGGLIWIEVAEQARVDGTLTAVGGNASSGSGSAGGGSGGGILLACQRLATAPTTLLAANGGSTASSGYTTPGDGGGGRIAVWLGTILPLDRERLLAGDGPEVMHSMQWIGEPLETADPRFWGAMQPYQGTYTVRGGTYYDNAEDGTLRFLRIVNSGTVLLLR